MAILADDARLHALARDLGAGLAARGLLLVTAESCTGGWVAQAVTSVAGSSRWFDRGFVTYSNLAKEEMLDVKSETLERHGAVSEQTVREMAEGALRHSHADLSVALSGIAGPGGASATKPVGTVCLAWADGRGATRAVREQFSGDREVIRRQAVARALVGLLDVLAEGR